SLRASRSLGAVETASVQLTVWAWLLLLTGRLGLVLSLTDHAVQFARRSHLTAYLLEIIAIRALALFAAGRHEAGRAQLADALKEFEARSPFDIRMMAR